jgi:hypothetical protein
MGRWEFMGSFFFSVSTITTIGKGSVGLGEGLGWGGQSLLGGLWDWWPLEGLPRVSHLPE